MKVSDFQKYLRCLADAIATKAPAKELTDAADALGPFGHYPMAAFAEFLTRAEAKYGATGELPDGRPPKPALAPRPPKSAPGPAPTVDALVAAVEALRIRLRTDRTLTRDGVADALRQFERLKKADLLAGVRRLGMQARPATMKEAMTAIVNHTVAAQGGVERSDA